MAIGDYTNVLQQFYISYFGRPADPIGLQSAAQALNNAGAPTTTQGLVTSYATNATVRTLIDNFGNSAESAALYGSVTTPDTITNFVTQIYLNVLDRQPDLAGLLYWSGEISSGRLIPSRVALTILDAATRTADAPTVANKLAVANNFTTNLDTVAEINAYSGNVAAGLARDLLSNVDGTTNVAAFQPNVLQTIVNIVNGANAAGAFTLTANTDVASANVFNAPQVFTPGGNDRINSLQDEDRLTGTGTNPTLNVTLGTPNDNGDATITPTLSGIATINAAFTSSSTGLELDLQDAVGVNTVNVTRVSSGGATVDNMTTSVNALSIVNSSDKANVSLLYSNNQLAGTADAVTLALNNDNIGTLTVGSNGNNVAGDPTNQIETLTINTLGASTGIDTLNTVAVDNQNIQINAGAALTIAGLANAGGVQRIGVTGASNVTLGAVGSDTLNATTGFVLAGGTHTGNLTANITNAAAQTTSSFTSGTGNDVITSTATLNGDVVTNAGTDTVGITGNVGILGSIDTGAGADAVNVSGNLLGTVAGGATVSTGDDADSVFVGTVPVGGFLAVVPDVAVPAPIVVLGVVVNQAAIDAANQQNAIIAAGNAAALANNNAINGARGNGNLGEEATITTGAGNDAVTLTGALTGDTEGALTGDNLGAVISLGDGDDTLLFNRINQGAGATLVGGEINGGSGTNTLTVDSNAGATTLAAVSAANADRVVGFQTMNLISAQAIDEELRNTVNAIGGVQIVVNDADVDGASNAETTDYTADINEFTGLTTINLENKAGIIDATPVEAVSASRFAGDAATYTISNLVGTEAVTLTTVEAITSVANRGLIGATVTDDLIADATLNVSLANDAGAADTIAVTIEGAGDVAINDLNATNGPGTADDGETENLTLTINGPASRSIILADNNFEGALRLQGNTTGTITAGAVVAAGNAVDTNNAVDASTIVSTLTGNVNITVADEANYNITTAGGNDVVNLLNDTVNVSDTIDLGAGTNRIIVNNDLRGNTNADADESFNNLRNIQELEIRGFAANQFTLPGSNPNVIEVTLDDDAQTTGVNRVILALDAGAAEPNVDLDIGVDFTNNLVIDLAAESSTIDIDNDANVNTVVNVNADQTGAANVGDADINFTDAGTGTVTLNITTDDDSNQNIGVGVLPANGVDLTVQDGDIDVINLIDGTSTARVAPGVATPATTITLTLDASYGPVGGTLTVDASSINDDDLDANNDGDLLDTGDIDDNQNLVINAAAADYKVNVKGSQLSDIITGSDFADTIDGQAGNDRIVAGLGADTVTGGAGNDAFAFAAPSASNSVTADTITDFTSGSDYAGFQLNANGNIVNASGFANVASTGLGDDSLIGTAGVRVVGDTFYSSGDGRLAVDADGDGDITGANDYVVNIGAAVNAGDVRYRIDGNGANDTIRGGQGADGVFSAGGDDTIVYLGSLTAADVAGYITAGSAAAVGITGAVAQVINYSELLTARTASEIGVDINGVGPAAAGETVDGGAGANDTIHTFGTANVSLINQGNVLTGVEFVVSHSNVTMTEVQFGGLVGFTFNGNNAHTLNIIDSNGNGSTPVLNINVVNVGANSTLDFNLISTAGAVVNATPAYNLTGSAADLLALPAGAVADAGTVTVTGTVTVAQALLLSALDNTIDYNISDTADNIGAAITGNAANMAAIAQADDIIVAGGNTTVAAARLILTDTDFNATSTFGITDTGANLASIAVPALPGTGDAAIASVLPIANIISFNAEPVDAVTLSITQYQAIGGRFTDGSDIVTVNGTVDPDTLVFNVNALAPVAVNLGEQAGVPDTITVQGNPGQQVRLTFTSADVGNPTALDGNNDNTGPVDVNLPYSGREDGGLAVRMQLETGPGVLDLGGPIHRFEDENILFDGVASGVTFDVRDIRGASRGEFQQVVLGSVAGDTVVANANNQYINGGGGDDILSAGGGFDFLVGGAGNDTLNVAEGTRVDILGGGGNDTVNVDAGVTVGVGSTWSLATAPVDAPADNLDTVVLNNAANIANVNGGNAVGSTEVLRLTNNSSATVSVNQHNGVTTIDAIGTNNLTVLGAGTLIGNATVETYTLNGGAATITVANNTQNVTGDNPNNQTVILLAANSAAYTGTLNAGDTGGDNDVLRASGTLSIAGATISPNSFETLDLDGSVVTTLSLTTTQHNEFAAITGSGLTDTIVLTTAGTATGDADINQYTLNQAITFTVGSNTQIVIGDNTASNFNQTVIVDGLTSTAAQVLDANTGATDILSLRNGANIALASVSDFEVLNVVGNVTMTAAQYDAFDANGNVTTVNPNITATGPTDQITFTTSGFGDGFDLDSEIETYVFASGDDVIYARTGLATEFRGTINISSGGTDNVRIYNVELNDFTGVTPFANYSTVIGFSTGIGNDTFQIDLNGANQGVGAGNYRTVTTLASNQGAGIANDIIEIHNTVGTVTSLLDNSAVQTLIIDAIGTVVENNVQATFVLYNNSGDAGIYNAVLTQGANQDVNDIGDIQIELVAVVNAVGVNSFVANNFVN